jgi:membrane dipeptidase
MELGNSAQKIHQNAIIIDGLVYGPAADSADYFRQAKEAGVTATNVTIPAVLDNFNETKKKMAYWHDRIGKNRDFMTLALSAADIERAKKDSKTAIIMGTQNAVHIDDNLENLEELHKLGMRIIQLTYQEKNSFGAGCGADPNIGLTKLGKELVRRMNDIGILVDLSHCGYKTTLDAIAESRYPCVFSHANVRALCDHVRNKTDEQIKAMADKGGVMGIVSYSPFADIKHNRVPAMPEFLDIVEYVINLAGVDHVGIGLDFTPTWTEAEYNKAQKTYPEIYMDYKMSDIPVRGLENISKVIAVTQGFVSRGYSEEDIRKILGGNFLRVFKEVWK